MSEIKEQQLNYELDILAKEAKAIQSRNANSNPVAEAWERLQKFVFQTDEKGEYILNENGRRKIAWTRIISRIIRLVALFVQYLEAKNADAKENAEFARNLGGALEAENQKLKAENETVKADNSELQKNINHLSKENEILRVEIEKLKATDIPEAKAKDEAPANNNTPPAPVKRK